MYEIIIFFIFADGGKDTFNFANGFSNVATCEQYIRDDRNKEREIKRIIDSIIDSDDSGSLGKPFCYPQRETVSI